MEENRINRVDQLKEFHEKIGATIGADLARPFTVVAEGSEKTASATVAKLDRLERGNNEALVQVGQALLTMAHGALLSYQASTDLRMLRSHLILEEVGELMIELAKRKEAKALKETVDAIYVLYGLAVAFDLPVEAAFDEVHASNMTKNSEANARTGDRGKGEGYVKADVEKILRAHRAAK